MRTTALALTGLATAAALAAPALAQSSFAVAAPAEQRAILVQCQNDLGYGAAGLTIGYGGSGAKGSPDMPAAVPNAQISPAAAAEINRCAVTSAEAVVYGTPAPKVYRHAPPGIIVSSAPRGTCPPGAPMIYGGALYCPKR